jgi:hypothetical protein
MSRSLRKEVPPHAHAVPGGRNPEASVLHHESDPSRPNTAATLSMTPASTRGSPQDSQ